MSSQRLLLLAVLLLYLSGCDAISPPSAELRLYQISDMEILLQDYFTNDLNRISPGLSCGDFKMQNRVGCFELLVDPSLSMVTKLVYRELSSNERIEIFAFDPPVNHVYIEKINESVLETSPALIKSRKILLAPEQPAVRLHFFEKSAVVFYWHNGKFEQIWTSD